ncbi:hydrolase [Penicillium atrosanguineum]|uniref:Hydrolase n=1 Tax=Penicillium atrosanguineum TaxID=1132637 RepID=A0A9W9L4D9_9EURO|nr:Polyketide synthase enoylreductase [Penicillium atrosanguineum]KAJ5125452.1 hydrolase [Penicillium atrosanguineum]KAJ5136218.1 hydrolase [Penicillium atrosanguineum]KAJ5292568.1 Polyketide synthase enoylreductase [Penicillium atrosanguineum]KAJ5303409.1 hydrolase [Penicillium atrosanguineum]
MTSLAARTIRSSIMSVAECKHLRPRRFAPLDPTRASDAPTLKGIIFDVDGTLCLPQHHMFSEMREALGIDNSIDILHHIRDLPTAEDQAAAVAKVQAVEQKAMLEQQPQPGLARLMDYLKSRSLRRGLCTRNFEAPVQYLIQNHMPSHVFLPIITRDTPNVIPKPDPAGILHIAREWGLTNRAENLIMVGDSIDDMTSGHMAGAATVLLVNEHNSHLQEHAHTDLCINQLDELVDILERGFVGTREP